MEIVHDLKVATIGRDPCAFWEKRPNLLFHEAARVTDGEEALLFVAQVGIDAGAVRDVIPGTDLGRCRNGMICAGGGAIALREGALAVVDQ